MIIEVYSDNMSKIHPQDGILIGAVSETVTKDPTRVKNSITKNFMWKYKINCLRSLFYIYINKRKFLRVCVCSRHYGLPMVREC